MKLNPFLNQRLSRLVRRMRLARDDELHRALRIGQQTKQSLAGRAAVSSVSCKWRSGAQSPASARWDRTDASHAQPPPATRRKPPVAGTIVRGRTPPETCWRQCEIARAWRRNTAECPLQSFRRPQPAVLCHRRLSTDHRPQPSPMSACGRRWSRGRPGSRSRASAETAAERYAGSPSHASGLRH